MHTHLHTKHKKNKIKENEQDFELLMIGHCTKHNTFTIIIEYDNDIYWYITVSKEISLNLLAMNIAIFIVFLKGN